MPDSGKKVLVFFTNECGNGRRTCAEYIAPRAVLADDMWEDTSDDWFDIDEQGNSWVPTGWYETSETADERVYRQMPITHWMPLPEIPT